MIHPLKIGQTIKKLRNEHNLSQDQCAEKLFVTRQAISRWETGQSLPSIECLVRMKAMFSVTLEELLAIKDTLNHEEIEASLNTSNRLVTLYALVDDAKHQGKVLELWHTLSSDERLILVKRMLLKETFPDCAQFLPRLTYAERRLVIMHYKNTHSPKDLTTSVDLLSRAERQLLGGTYEFNKNVTIFRR